MLKNVKTKQVIQMVYTSGNPEGRSNKKGVYERMGRIEPLGVKGFKPGDKVYYDVFPWDINIKGVIYKIPKDNQYGDEYEGKLGIHSRGKHKKEFKKCGVDEDIPFEDTDDTRHRD